MLLSDEEYLTQAVQLAVDNVHAGGGPFGALIVLENGSIYEGVNRVTANNDPTAHAEVMAIRNACAGIDDFSLLGATLYTSCEPCPMCLGAALWSCVHRVIFAANRYDAADAGFDDAAFYQLLAEGKVAVELKISNPTAPFITWNETTGRTEY